MKGFTRFLIRTIPIATLLIAVITGLTTILIYGGTYTYLETQTINDQEYIIFNFKNYIDGLNVNNVDTQFLQGLDISQIYEDYTNANNEAEWYQKIANTVIMVVNYLIYLINVVIIPIKIIGIVLYFVMSLLGFKMNQQIAWDQFPLGAFINLCRGLTIPYIPYLS